MAEIAKHKQNQQCEICLRDFVKSDLHNILTIHSDGEVMKHLGTKSKKQCTNYLQKGLTKSKPNEFKQIGDKAIFAIILKTVDNDEKESNDIMIGTSELSYDDDKSKLATIEYVLDKKMWGKGFGTNTCLKIMEHGFDVLKMNILRAMIVQSNIGSIKVVEKCGFIMKNKVEYNLNGKERKLFNYEITKQEYIECISQ
eukprot:403896_1